MDELIALFIYYFPALQCCGGKTCAADAVCVNYVCMCKEGYYGDGLTACSRKLILNVQAKFFIRCFIATRARNYFLLFDTILYCAALL